MIQYGNFYIPEAGKYLVDSSNTNYFRVSSDIECHEEDFEMNLEKVSDNIFILDNRFEIRLSDETKKELVGMLFSNDDQIAIMLNYQSHKTVENVKVYKLMQDWRDWFSLLIKKMRDYGTQDN